MNRKQRGGLLVSIVSWVVLASVMQDRALAEGEQTLLVLTLLAIGFVGAYMLMGD